LFIYRDSVDDGISHVDAVPRGRVTAVGFASATSFFLWAFVVLMGGLGDEFQLTPLVGPSSVILPMLPWGFGFLELLQWGRDAGTEDDFVSDMAPSFED
jgi:hypothetical protein